MMMRAGIRIQRFEDHNEKAACSMPKAVLRLSGHSFA
jgi:hypothetical protein